MQMLESHHITNHHHERRQRLKQKTKIRCCPHSSLALKVVVALEKGGGGGGEIPNGLWDELESLLGFEEGHLCHYYAHLVENPSTAKAFVTLSFSNKLIWVTRYVTKNFGPIR